MSKHTPGPWRVNGNNKFRWIVADSEVFTHSDDVTCSAYGGNMVCESVHEANAHLIAAAPELLEALQRLLAAYSVSHSQEHRQSCWDQARTAIAKAEGQ